MHENHKYTLGISHNNQQYMTFDKSFCLTMSTLLCSNAENLTEETCGEIMETQDDLNINNNVPEGRKPCEDTAGSNNDSLDIVTETCGEDMETQDDLDSNNNVPDGRKPCEDTAGRDNDSLHIVTFPVKKKVKLVDKAASKHKDTCKFI